MSDKELGEVGETNHHFKFDADGLGTMICVGDMVTMFLCMEDCKYMQGQIIATSIKS